AGAPHGEDSPMTLTVIDGGNGTDTSGPSDDDTSDAKLAQAYRDLETDVRDLAQMSRLVLTAVMESTEEPESDKGYALFAADVCQKVIKDFTRRYYAGLGEANDVYGRNAQWPGIIDLGPTADGFGGAPEELGRLGPSPRLTFTVTHPATLEADGKPGKVVVARLVIPTENLRVIA